MHHYGVSPVFSFLLVQNIQDFGNGIWLMLLDFAAFNIWVFGKLLISRDNAKSG